MSIKLVRNQAPAALGSLEVLAFFTWRIQALALGKAPTALSGSYLQLFEFMEDFYNGTIVRRRHFKTNFRRYFASTEEAYVGKESPPFSKGGQGGLYKCLIILLVKGDLKPPFPTFHWLREHIESSAQNHFVILSEAKDLVFSRIYEILRSLRSLRMTGEGISQRSYICSLRQVLH